MAVVLSITEVDYERLLSLAGSQRELFDFDLSESGLSEKQRRLNTELVEMIARAKSYDAYRGLMLDFASSVYGENYRLISGAVSGEIAIEGLNWRVAESDQAENALPSLKQGDDEFSLEDEEGAASTTVPGLEDDLVVVEPAEQVPGYLNNPLGVAYFESSALDPEQEKVLPVKKSDAIQFFMRAALDAKSSLVPQDLRQFDLPFDAISLNSYAEFLAVLGKKPLSGRQQDVLSKQSAENKERLDFFTRAIGNSVEQVAKRSARLMEQMVLISVGSEDQGVSVKGLSFFLGETISGRANEFLASEMGPWFAAKMKEFGQTDLKSSAGKKGQAADAETSSDSDNTFVFDGQIRSFNETRWTPGELEQYKTELASGAAKAQQAFRDALDDEKARLIDFYGEEGIKEKSLDIGTLALESLEQQGIVAPEPIRRKVFAEVPQHVKDMALSLDEIFERKKNKEDLSAWDDPEDDEAQLLFNKSIATLKWAVNNARVQVAYSGGKDSSVLLYALLKAMKENQLEGKKNFPVRVISSDTLIENPEIANNLKLDHQAITEWAKLNDLDIECRVATPALLTQYQVAQVGGRKLHNMPSKSSECSSDWKVAAMVELRHQWRKEVQNEPIITITGTRTEESLHRGNSMRKREDSDEKITVSDRDELIMSPIASMSTNHVFKILDVHLAGEIADLKKQGVTQKDWPYPTDGTRTQRIYSDAASSSCEIVNTQVASTKGAGCGARTGCWNCQKVLNDSSAENMLQNSPEAYAYMAPLLRYRKWVSDMHDDPVSRSFVGRSITEDGLLKFGHDNYHPKFLQDMLRYLLTMQIEHDQIINIQKIANPGKDYPELTIFTPEQLISVQYEWSRYGREANHPFEAFRIYDEVYNQGKRFYPPVLGAMDTAKVAPLPSPPSNGFIRVGTPFRDYKPDNMAFVHDSGSGLVGYSQANQGLQDVLLEMASFDGSNVHKTVRDEVTGSVTRFLDGLDEANKYEVDQEAAADFIAFELTWLVEQANTNPPAICAGHAAKVLLQSGVVRPRNIKAQHELISKFQYLESRNLTAATYDHARCLEQLIDKNGRPIKDKAPFTLEHYYLPPEKASKKIAEQQSLLSMGRSKNASGQPNSISMSKDEFKKYKRLEVQASNSKVLSQVNDVLAKHFDSQKALSNSNLAQAVSVAGQVAAALSEVKTKQIEIAQTRNNEDPSMHLLARSQKEKSLDALASLVGSVKDLVTNQSNISNVQACKETMKSITSICLRASEVVNDIAAIEVQRRIAEQAAQRSTDSPVITEHVVSFVSSR